MKNYLNQPQPIIHKEGSIALNNDTTNSLLNILTRTAVQLKGKGNTLELHETLIECLKLCPPKLSKNTITRSSYNAGAKAFKNGVSIKEITDLDGYHKNSWLEGWEDAALGAGKALKEMTTN